MIRYYAVHMAGPYHLDSGLPCQDSFFVKRDPGGVVYASAADGLGSESRSDVGARIAARQACEPLHGALQKRDAVFPGEENHEQRLRVRL